MNKSRLLLIFFAVFILFDVFLIGYYLTKNSSKKTSPTSLKSSGIIAKVGNENIYQKNLDYELQGHPENATDGIEQRLLDKIILDSIILQGGAQDGIITLDSNIYNSPDMNYVDRIAKVEMVKNKINELSINLKGSVISIWFHNSGYIGPLGIEQGKQIAFEKISDLRKQIVDKKITIKEAGAIIKKDDSLFQIDRAWKSNAIFDFSVSADQRITFSREFDQIIRNLKLNEVSEVYLAEDVDPEGKKLYEALYFVAQVSEKNNKQGVSNYESWLQSKKNTYVVQKY